MDPQSSIPFDSILQWNINGLKANRNDLKQLIHQYNPFCITLNETRLSNQREFTERSFKNYTTLSNPNRNDLGNLIMIRKDINYIPLTLRTSLNALGIEINKQGKTVKICSIYLSPSIPICLPDIENLINQ